MGQNVERKEYGIDILYLWPGFSNEFQSCLGAHTAIVHEIRCNNSRTAACRVSGALEVVKQCKRRTDSSLTMDKHPMTLVQLGLYKRDTR